MSEILNEEVEAAIDEMVEESIVDTYYRMGHLINELSTGLLARAADEAGKRAKTAGDGKYSAAERRTKKRQARKFEGELKKRHDRAEQVAGDVARAKIKKAKQSPSVKYSHKAQQKAENEYDAKMTSRENKEAKARKKGSVVRAVKRTARMVNLGGAEGRRREKRYGK